MEIELDNINYHDVWFINIQTFPSVYNHRLREMEQFSADLTVTEYSNQTIAKHNYITLNLRSIVDKKKRKRIYIYIYSSYWLVHIPVSNVHLQIYRFPSNLTRYRWLPQPGGLPCKVNLWACNTNPTTWSHLSN